MKIQFATIYLVLLANVLIAQKEDFTWPLGQNGPNNLELDGVGLTFMQFDNWELSQSHIPLYADFDYTHASICDSAGNLLMYTNGITIWNKNHEIMENGEGLNPGASATSSSYLGYGIPQGAIILPVPEAIGQYYLFHERILYPSETPLSFTHVNPFYYTKIDLSANNGLGAVVEKNVVLVDDTLCAGPISAIRHANGRDWWIYCREYKKVNYYTFLLDPGGIHLVTKQEFPSLSPDGGLAGGQAVFSKDGSLFVSYRVSSLIQIDFFDVDRCTGLFSNPRGVGFLEAVGASGIALSPNGRFLYHSGGPALWQFDLWEEDLFAGRIQLDTIFDPQTQILPYYSQSYLAPDGKIYISTTKHEPFCHVIHQPDKKGPACQAEREGVEILSYVQRTMPNLPNFRLGPQDGSSCDSLGIDNLPLAAFNYSDTGLVLHFRDLSAYEPAAWYWSFGDGSSATDTSPVHVYADTGSYEVCQTVSNANGSDTWCRQVQVQALPSSLPGRSLVDLQVYPNPVTEHLHLLLPRQHKLERLRLYNLKGQKVLETDLKGRSVLTWAVGHLPPGLYVLEGVGARERVLERVVIQH